MQRRDEARINHDLGQELQLLTGEEIGAPGVEVIEQWPPARPPMRGQPSREAPPAIDKEVPQSVLGGQRVEVEFDGLVFDQRCAIDDFDPPGGLSRPDQPAQLATEFLLPLSPLSRPLNGFVSIFLRCREFYPLRPWI